MPLYRYQAVAATGELVSGEMEAPDQTHVVEHLQALGHVPIHADKAGRAWLSRLLSRPLLGSPKPKTGDLVLLTQQLGTLLHAGLSLDRALEITQTMVEGKAERECLRRVLELIRGGSSLADAMTAQNGIFPPSYIGAVRAGEAGGSLDTTLQNIAEFLERSQAAREQVKSALVYPILVLATGCASIAVLFGFVVPRFRPVFEQLGAQPPMMAQIVLAAGDVFSTYWWVPVIGIALLYLLWRRRGQSPEARRRWHSRILALPHFGDLIIKIEMARFGRTLGTLLKNGVAPITALAITEQSLNNTAIRAGIAAVSDRMKEGKGLADPLSQTRFVPALVVHMVRVGEETARLDELLLKVAEIYERETRHAIDRLLALLVPAITIGLGLVVAVVIGSILTAILSVYDLAL